VGEHYSSIAEPNAHTDSKSYPWGFAIGNSSDARSITDFDLRVSDRDANAVAEEVNRRFQTAVP
jgi:hypothetical protein